MAIMTETDDAESPKRDDAEMEEDTSTIPRQGTFAKSPAEVLRCRFVVAQVAFNAVASLLGPLGTFFLLFGYLSQGPYEWNTGPLVGVVVGSLVGSPILIFALMPVGMPEAVETGWFLKLRLEDCPTWLQPLLKDRCQWSTTRLLLLGLVVGVVYVPIALLLARFAVGPTLSTWTLIWFNVAYEVCLAIPITALGLLGYAVEDNLDRTLARMSQNPNVIQRLLRRCGSSLKLTLCPYNSNCEDENERNGNS
jgi:hypothetical protein